MHEESLFLLTYSIKIAERFLASLGMTKSGALFPSRKHQSVFYLIDYIATANVLRRISDCI